VPNIVAVPGVELAGLLPAELQHYTVFSAAIAAQPNDAKAAEALVKFLMSPQATSVLETKGLERIAH
jgi:molybdate transport system substrate-binding protein